MIDSYLHERAMEEPMALERDYEREMEELREWYEDEMTQYVREQQKKLEDGWRADIAWHEADERADERARAEQDDWENRYGYW